MTNFSTPYGPAGRWSTRFGKLNTSWEFDEEGETGHERTSYSIDAQGKTLHLGEDIFGGRAPDFLRSAGHP